MKNTNQMFRPLGVVVVNKMKLKINKYILEYEFIIAQIEIIFQNYEWTAGHSIVQPLDNWTVAVQPLDY